MSQPYPLQLAPESAIYVAEPAGVVERFWTLAKLEFERRIDRAARASDVSDEILRELGRGEFCECGNTDTLDERLNNYAMRNWTFVADTIGAWGVETDRSEREREDYR